MRTFTIEHDTKRYGDSTGGLKHFGPRIVVSGVTAEQAEAIADAMSGCFDAGLTDQYVIQRCTASPAVLMSNPPQFQCRKCGQRWIQGDEPPMCYGWIVKADPYHERDIKAVAEWLDEAHRSALETAFGCSHGLPEGHCIYCDPANALPFASSQGVER